MRRSVALLLLAGAALGSSGCAGPAVRRAAERSLERRLHEILGPAEKYEVRIQKTSASRLVRGSVERLVVDASGVQLDAYTRLERIHIVVHDLVIDEDEVEIGSAREGLIRVEVTEVDINRYLSSRHARHEPEVKLLPGAIVASIRSPLRGASSRVTATGRLLVEEGLRLVFRADEVDLELLDVPGFSERYVEERINPLVDLSKLKYPARLNELVVMKGLVRVRGAVALPEKADRA